MTTAKKKRKKVRRGRPPLPVSERTVPRQVSLRPIDLAALGELREVHGLASDSAALRWLVTRWYARRGRGKVRASAPRPARTD